MEEESLSKQAKKLERYINTLPHAKQLNKLSSAPREVMIALTTSIFQARRATETYSGSDDTEEQLMALEEAIMSYKQVNKSILLASSYDLIDTVDVAHLSALCEQILDRLRG